MRQMRGDERGQGLTEYALLLAGIAAIIVIALVALQSGILDIVGDIFGGASPAP
jgi:Flp pilus assembly pilin Flp